MLATQPSLFSSAFYLSNILHISMVYWLNKPCGMFKEHVKRLSQDKGKWFTSFSSVIPATCCKWFIEPKNHMIYWYNNQQVLTNHSVYIIFSYWIIKYILWLKFSFDLKIYKLIYFVFSFVLDPFSIIWGKGKQKLNWFKIFKPKTIFYQTYTCTGHV